MDQSLPIIDMSPLASSPDGLAAVASDIGKAARGAGFFYLTGHGIDPALISAVFRESARFFSLPESEKSQQSITRSPHNRGYVAMKGESLDPTKAADLKEAFNIGLDLAADDPRVLAGEAVPRRQSVAGARRMANDHACLFRRGLVGRASPAQRHRPRPRPRPGFLRGQARPADGDAAPAALSAAAGNRGQPGRSAPANTPTTAT